MDWHKKVNPVNLPVLMIGQMDYAEKTFIG